MNNCILCKAPCHGSMCEDCSFDLEIVDANVLNRFLHTEATRKVEEKRISEESVDELQQES